MDQRLAAANQLVRGSLRRHGVAGTVWRAMVASGRTARQMPYLHERHVWYQLDPERGRPRKELPGGFDLVRGGVDELPLLKQMQTVGYIEGLRRLGSGADLWLIRNGGNVAFFCWILRHRVPVMAAPGGWLDLPADIVCLEDTVTAPPYRGRGLAPVAYSWIIDSLAQEGVRAIITKIEETNAPARRAVEKAGFRPVATMSLVRVGWMRHVAVRPETGEDNSALLDLFPANGSGSKWGILGVIFAWIIR